MNQGQLVVIWIAGVLLAAVLVFVGLVSPYQAYKNKNPGPNQSFSEWVLDPPSTASSVRYSFRATKDQTIELPKPNYLVGVGAPVLILAACAFLSVTVAGKKTAQSPQGETKETVGNSSRHDG